VTVARIETERLVLRPFGPGDVEGLVALDSDPDVQRFSDPLAEHIPRDVEVLRRYVIATGLPVLMTTGDPREDRGFWAVDEQATGRFLGWFHLKHDDRPEAPELGYRLVPEGRGKGYATEGSRALIDLAFADRDVELVWAHTLRDNVASRRVLERLGMTYREDADYGGLPTVVYALRREEAGVLPSSG
jgi:RimJ/RimL family protein N-acetyltransferase